MAINEDLRMGSEARLWELIEQRTHAGANTEQIDRHIWELFGEEWAIVFTDLAGFSRKVTTFGIIHFLQTIFESKQLLFPVVRDHRGFLVKSEADSCLFLFRSPETAVQDKNGTMRSRSFVGQFLILDKQGFSESSADNFYEFNAKFVTDDLAEVTLIGRDGRRFDLVYERLGADVNLAAEAIAVTDELYGRYDKVLDSTVEILNDLKAFIRLHMRSHDYSPDDFNLRALEWQFEEEWLQIEGEVAMSAPSSELAGVTILADGSDPISQHFAQEFADVFGSGWTTDADLPDPETALEEYDPLSNDPEPVLFQVEPGIVGVEAGPIRDGLEKFAQSTVVVLNPFECEGGHDYVRDFYWVLSDGSILSYSTFPECD